MNSNRNMVWAAIAAAALLLSPSLAHGAFMHPVEGWAAHNQSTPPTVITNGGSNSPTFTPADEALTVMGTFPEIELLDDGDYVKLTTTLTTSTRFGNTGQNALNTMLRIGLYDGPAGPVMSEDAPNHGIFIVYANQAQADNRKVRVIETSTINPFSGSNDIGSGSEDVGLDSIRGANTGPVNFELTLTRNAGALDITAQISGTDSVTGNPYISNYTATGYVPSVVGFEFNRAGFFFGSRVDAPSATLQNVLITTNVPEPSSLVLVGIVMMAGGAAAVQRMRCASRARRLARS